MIINVVATRDAGIIKVDLAGWFTLPLVPAVKDKYPGGSIVYVRDPEEAQVFIETTAHQFPGAISIDLPYLWNEHVEISDSLHNSLSVYVNGEKKQTVVIGGEGKPTELYRVISLVAYPPWPPRKCHVIRAGESYPSIYRSVFGPASMGECQRWIETHDPDLRGSTPTSVTFRKRLTVRQLIQGLTEARERLAPLFGEDLSSEALRNLQELFMAGPGEYESIDILQLLNAYSERYVGENTRAWHHAAMAAALLANAVLQYM